MDTAVNETAATATRLSEADVELDGLVARVGRVEHLSCKVRKFERKVRRGSQETNTVGHVPAPLDTIVRAPRIRMQESARARRERGKRLAQAVCAPRENAATSHGAWAAAHICKQNKNE